jgi:hypothetical protein
MTSRLTTKDFRSRLEELTRQGQPWVMGTPFCVLYFNFGSQPFFGEIEDSTFRLTNNSAFSPGGSIIEGRFSGDAASAKVEYEIRTMKFPYFWIRFIPLLGLLVHNSFALFNTEIIGPPLIIGVNIFLVLLFFVGRWREKKRLNKLEKEFNNELGLC